MVKLLSERSCKGLEEYSISPLCQERQVIKALDCIVRIRFRYFFDDGFEVVPDGFLVS